MATETNPNYAVNRAWSLADSMVKSIRRYLANPLHPDDQGGGTTPLIEQADAVLARLQEVRGLLTSGEKAVPDSRVIEAIEAAVEFEVHVVVGTEIKKYDNPEGAKYEIGGLIGIARSAHQRD